MQGITKIWTIKKDKCRRFISVLISLLPDIYFSHSNEKGSNSYKSQSFILLKIIYAKSSLKTDFLWSDIKMRIIILQKYILWSLVKLKNHTREKGGAQLRTSFWHLLMNLKNNYLLKKLLSGPIKNIRILIFTMMYFLQK